jgi:hypothetical protein
MESIPLDERSTSVKIHEFEFGEIPAERVLGVYWNVQEDTLGIQIRATTDAVCTRRSILKVFSTVYDPLGIVGPFVLKAKQIFQEECRRVDKGWDDPIVDSSKRSWAKWLSELPQLQDVLLDRCLVPDGFDDVASAELHHYSDASQKGYGAVSYLRLKNAGGDVYCCFLLAKSKLAPIKSVTIPRLELMAAVVAVRLDATLRKELRLRINMSVFWTDSMIVLAYLKNTTSRFQTFVANRVSMIHDLSEPKQWRPCLPWFEWSRDGCLQCVVTGAGVSVEV